MPSRRRGAEVRVDALDRRRARAPANPASAAPMMNVSCRARTVLMPWLRASGSFVITARIVRPMVVKRTMSAERRDESRTRAG